MGCLSRYVAFLLREIRSSIQYLGIGSFPGKLVTLMLSNPNRQWCSVTSALRDSRNTTLGPWLVPGQGQPSLAGKIGGPDVTALRSLRSLTLQSFCAFNGPYLPGKRKMTELSSWRWMGI